MLNMCIPHSSKQHTVSGKKDCPFHVACHAVHNILQLVDGHRGKDRGLFSTCTEFGWMYSFVLLCIKRQFQILDQRMQRIVGSCRRLVLLDESCQLKGSKSGHVHLQGRGKGTKLFGPYTQQTQNTQLLDTYVTCFF